MTDDEVFAMITRHRLRAVDELSTLNAQEWETPSWCDGWRVRDVLGHLVSILELPMWKVILGITRAGGFDRWTRRTAQQFGARPIDELLGSYRSLAPKRFTPPGAGPAAPLTDIAVHSFDMLGPLGRRVEVEEPALEIILGYLLGKKAKIFIPPSRIAGLRFEATDVGVAVGTGALVRGSGTALMLAITGRPGGLVDLDGDGVATLRSRIGS